MNKVEKPRATKLNATLDFSQLVPIEKMIGDSEKDTHLLREMHRKAREFLLSFDWCKNIRRDWFGQGVGDVYAVFLFEIDPNTKDIDNLLWVVVGDLPPAYLVVDEAPTPIAALQNYVELMQEWDEKVEAGESVESCVPVNAPATREYADLLQRRLRFIKKEFLK